MSELEQPDRLCPQCGEQIPSGSHRCRRCDPGSYTTGNARLTAAASFAVIALPALWIGGVVVHVWAVVLVLKEFGLLGALLGLVTPVLVWLVMMIKIIGESGFGHPYVIAVAAYAVLGIVFFAVMARTE